MCGQVDEAGAAPEGGWAHRARLRSRVQTVVLFVGSGGSSVTGTDHTQ